MATLLFGPLVTDARGSIRGTTFSRAISGATARARPRPPRPHTALQFSRQTELSTAAEQWRITPPAIKTDWETYAASVTLTNRLGQSFTPTGQMMQIRYVCWQLRAGITVPVLTAPIAGGLPSVPAFTFDLNGDDLRVTAAVPAPSSPDQWLFNIYRPSTVAQASRRFLLSSILMDYNDTYPTVIATDYVADYTATNVIFVKITAVLMNGAGRTSNLQSNLLQMTVP